MAFKNKDVNKKMARLGKDSKMGKIRKRVLKVKGNDPIPGKEERAIKRDAERFDDADLQAIVEGTESEEEKKSRNGLVRASEGELEIRRKQVLRLMLRGVPKVTMSNFLQISTATLYRDIEAINDQMRFEVQNLDLPLFVGQTRAFFRECRDICMRMATDTKQNDSRVKLMAVRTALDAEREEHRYLSLTGLYGVANKSHALYRNVGQQDDLDAVDDGEDFQKFFDSYYEKNTRKQPVTIDG